MGPDVGTPNRTRNSKWVRLRFEFITSRGQNDKVVGNEKHMLIEEKSAGKDH